MCGLVGIVSCHSIHNRDWLAIGRDAMTHRGPDDMGEWWSNDGRVGFAHRRLSVIDVSSAGHQPMTDSVGTLTIIFNGEIYNFIELRLELAAKGAVFRSHSDTEVILAAYREWGKNCLSHLNGMFVFAIYDSQQQIMFLARDRAGEKPLFYHYENGTFRFASEIKALLTDITLPRRIDLDALDCYLAMGYVPAERCILQGFHKLPPAHALQFDLQNGAVLFWRYWQLPELDFDASNGKVNEQELLDELEILLRDAVSRQLVADVPVGVLLSGGVDSSLITAMAVRESNKVKTFTVRFPGYGKFDETEHARLIARHFNTDHMELDMQPAVADLLPCLARQFDEPMVDSSMLPTFLVSQLVRQHCVVALGGDGGDELFGGYGRYSRLLWMQAHLGRIPLPLRQAISLFAEHCLPIGFTGRSWLQGMDMDLNNALPLMPTLFDATTRVRLMRRYADWHPLAESVMAGRLPLNSDILQRATRMDFANYFSEDILVKVDRASMLNSLEIRAPLLDYRLIEFAFARVPSHLKATHQNKKILLKRLASRILPPEFDLNRKQGFSIPLADWLKGGPFRDIFYDVLLDSGSIFDQLTVRRLLYGQRHGRNNAERLFSLVLFELWRREYAVTY